MSKVQREQYPEYAAYYQKLNQRFFSGELPEVPIMVTSGLVSDLPAAYCEYGETPGIEINHKFTRNKEKTALYILYCMVEQYAAIHKIMYFHLNYLHWSGDEPYFLEAMKHGFNEGYEPTEETMEFIRNMVNK